MSSKFENVPVENDTDILFELEANLGDYDILYQKWYWDGITAESIIFLTEDLDGLGAEEIIEEVRKSPLVNEGSQITYKSGDSGYTFANFNFEA